MIPHRGSVEIWIGTKLTLSMTFTVKIFLLQCILLITRNNSLKGTMDIKKPLLQEKDVYLCGLDLHLDVAILILDHRIVNTVAENRSVTECFLHAEIFHYSCIPIYLTS